MKYTILSLLFLFISPFAYAEAPYYVESFSSVPYYEENYPLGNGDQSSFFDTEENVLCELLGDDLFELVKTQWTAQTSFEDQQGLWIANMCPPEQCYSENLTLILDPLDGMLLAIHCHKNEQGFIETEWLGGSLAFPLKKQVGNCFYQKDVSEIKRLGLLLKN